MTERISLIPAAGKGTRAYPYTKIFPRDCSKSPASHCWSIWWSCSATS